MDLEIMVFSVWENSGMMAAQKNTVASTTRTGSPGFVRLQRSGASSATPRPASSGSLAGGKTVCGTCGTVHRSFYDHRVRQVRDLSCGGTRVYLELPIRRVQCRRCGKVKREALPFLADNPFCTKRFAFAVGQRCRSASVKAVAKELALDWHTVKELEKQYM
jgi:transposase